MRDLLSFLKSIFISHAAFSLVIVGILLFSIPVTFYLSQRTQILKSKATECPEVLVEYKEICDVPDEEEEVSQPEAEPEDEVNPYSSQYGSEYDYEYESEYSAEQSVEGCRLEPVYERICPEPELGEGIEPEDPEEGIIDDIVAGIVDILPGEDEIEPTPEPEPTPDPTPEPQCSEDEWEFAGCNANSCGGEYWRCPKTGQVRGEGTGSGGDCVSEDNPVCSEQDPILNVPPPEPEPVEEVAPKVTTVVVETRKAQYEVVKEAYTCQAALSCHTDSEGNNTGMATKRWTNVNSNYLGSNVGCPGEQVVGAGSECPAGDSYSGVTFKEETFEDVRTHLVAPALYSKVNQCERIEKSEVTDCSNGQECRTYYFADTSTQCSWQVSGSDCKEASHCGGEGLGWLAKTPNCEYSQSSQEYQCANGYRCWNDRYRDISTGCGWQNKDPHFHCDADESCREKAPSAVPPEFQSPVDRFTSFAGNFAGNIVPTVSSGIDNIIKSGDFVADRITDAARFVTSGEYDYKGDLSETVSPSVWIDRLQRGRESDLAKADEEERQRLLSPECLAGNSEACQPRSIEQTTQEALNKADETASLNQTLKDVYGINMDVSEEKLLVNFCGGKAKYCLVKEISVSSSDLYSQVRKGQVEELKQKLGLQGDDTNAWDPAKKEFFFNAMARGSVNAQKLLAENWTPVTAYENAHVAESICKKDWGNICIVGESRSDGILEATESDFSKLNTEARRLNPEFVPADVAVVKAYAQLSIGREVLDPYAEAVFQSSPELQNQLIEAMSVELGRSVSLEEINAAKQTTKTYFQAGANFRNTEEAGKLVKETNQSAFTESLVSAAFGAADLPDALNIVSGIGRAVVVRQLAKSIYGNANESLAKRSAEELTDIIARQESGYILSQRQIQKLEQAVASLDGEVTGGVSPEDLVKRLKADLPSEEVTPMELVQQALPDDPATQNAVQLALDGFDDASLRLANNLPPTPVVVIADANQIQFKYVSGGVGDTVEDVQEGFTDGVLRLFGNNRIDNEELKAVEGLNNGVLEGVGRDALAVGDEVVVLASADEIISLDDVARGLGDIEAGVQARKVPLEGPKPEISDQDREVMEALMLEHGLTEDTILYRYTDPKFVKGDEIIANPNSMALVVDHYNLVDHPLKKQYFDEFGEDTNLVPAWVEAKTLEYPTFNVSSVASHYASNSGPMLVGFRLGDVLEQGGKLYPDGGGIGANSWIVTVPEGGVKIVQKGGINPAGKIELSKVGDLDAPKVSELVNDDAFRVSQFTTSEGIPVREEDGVKDLADKLSQYKSIANQLGSGDIVNRVNDIEENLVFLGTKEFDRGTREIAQRVVGHVESGKKVLIYTPLDLRDAGSEPFVVASVLEHLPASISRGDVLVSGNTADIADAVKSQNGQVKVLFIDDMSVSGTQVEYRASLLRIVLNGEGFSDDEVRQIVELDFLASAEKQIQAVNFSDKDNPLNLPVNAVYKLDQDTNAEVGVRVSSIWSSTDGGFDVDIRAIVNELNGKIASLDPEERLRVGVQAQLQTPLLVGIKRPYKADFEKESTFDPEFLKHWEDLQDSYKLDPANLAPEGGQNIFQRAQETVIGWFDNIFRREKKVEEGQSSEITQQIEQQIEQEVIQELKPVQIFKGGTFVEGVFFKAETDLGPLTEKERTAFKQIADSFALVTNRVRALARETDGQHIRASFDDQEQALMDIFTKLKGKDFVVVPNGQRPEVIERIDIYESTTDGRLSIRRVVETLSPTGGANGFVLIPRTSEAEEKTIRLYRGVDSFNPNYPQTAPIKRITVSGVKDSDMDAFLEGRISIDTLAEKSGDKFFKQAIASERAFRKSRGEKALTDMEMMAYIHSGCQRGINCGSIFVSTTKDPSVALRFQNETAGGIVVLDVPESQIVDLETILKGADLWDREEAEVGVKGSLQPQWYRGFIPSEGMDEAKLAKVVGDFDEADKQLQVRIKAEPNLEPCPISLIPATFAANSPCKPQNIFQKVGGFIKEKWDGIFGTKKIVKPPQIEDLVTEVNTLQGTERVKEVKKLISVGLEDRSMVDVLNAFIDNNHSTSIQSHLREGEAGSVRDFVEKIDQVASSAVESSSKSVDDLSKQLQKGGLPLLQDDSSLFNINPETGQSKLREWVAVRRENLDFTNITIRDLVEDEERAKALTQSVVDRIVNEIEPVARQEVDQMVVQAASANIPIVSRSVRSKEIDKLLEKIRIKVGLGRNDYSLADVTDLTGGRIVVEDLPSLERLMKIVDDYYGPSGRILEKDNKYVSSIGSNDQYRAIHYLIKIGENDVYELQLNTRMVRIGADLSHDSIYKSHMGFSDDLKGTISEFNWKILGFELQKYNE